MQNQVRHGTPSVILLDDSEMTPLRTALESPPHIDESPHSDGSQA